MPKLLPPIVFIGALVALAAPANAGHSRLEASSSIVPDETGEPTTKYTPIHVKLSGHVISIKDCRVSRDVSFKHDMVSGRHVHDGESYPSDRRGRFGVELTFRYSFTDEDGFHDGEVGTAGGPVIVKMSTGRVLKPGTSHFRKGHHYCSRLTGTETVNIPAAAPDPPGF